MNRGINESRGPSAFLMVFAAAAAALSLTACGDAQEYGAAVSAEQPLIYGADNRADVYDASDRNLAALGRRSSVALFRRARVNQSNPNDVRFVDSGLLGSKMLSTIDGEKGPLCAEDRFSAEASASRCSGTLIGEDLVLVAGHCFTAEVPCQDTQFVFGFYRDSPSALHTITSQDVYDCKEEVVRLFASPAGLDYSIVRLTRNAGERYATPPVQTQNERISPTAGVATVGTPEGIALKIADAARVTDPRSTDVGYWTSTLDTSSGNSGGGVYDTSNYTLKGIHSRSTGQTFRKDPQRACLHWNTCSESNLWLCGGSSEVYVSRAIQALCAKEPNNALCGSQKQLAFDSAATQRATKDTRNQWIYVPAGKQVSISSCSGAGRYSGDTFFRLFNNEGQEVASDDDTCAHYGGSAIQFTAPTSGLYEFRAGCYDSDSCSGVAEWTVQ
jgi:hypothetical protein